jgi:hypothetical protein
MHFLGDKTEAGLRDIFETSFVETLAKMSDGHKQLLTSSLVATFCVLLAEHEIHGVLEGRIGRVKQCYNTYGKFISVAWAFVDAVLDFVEMATNPFADLRIWAQTTLAISIC